MNKTDAKQKICPLFLTMAGNLAIKVHESFGDDEQTVKALRQSYCAASACMMWRWENQSEGDVERHGKQGNCGLAGNKYHE